MKFLRAALARIAGFFGGSRADDDLRDELLAHLDMETAEYIRRGMEPEPHGGRPFWSPGNHPGRRGGARSARTAVAR